MREGTVHILFVGGPYDGSIHTIENPEPVIQFPIEITGNDERGYMVNWARYRRSRVENVAEGWRFRGKQGLWVYAGEQWQEADPGGELPPPAPVPGKETT